MPGNLHLILPTLKSRLNIKSFDVKFKELLPSDMKWLSFMGGELNNAAYYFSPFGDVNDDTKMVCNGSLREDANCTWHPWEYHHRINVAGKVALEKEDIGSKKVSETTKGNQVLKYIREQGSQQGSEHIIGKLIDLGMAEPLHDTNNAWSGMHLLIL